METKQFSLEVGGKKLTVEFNDLAENADGSVMIKCGGTTILATAVMAKNAEPSGDFFPLTVEYEEKFYASGQIRGSRYVRREGKPSDEAILSARIIDRTIRPLFDSWIRNEIQVIVTVLAYDSENDPDILAVIAASLALGISKIPFHGPVSAVRVRKNKSGDLQINPIQKERADSIGYMELTACGKDKNINMIELGADEVQEKSVVEALQRASDEIEKINAWQKEIIAQIGKEKVPIPEPLMPADDAAFAQIYLDRQLDQAIRKQILENNTRADGRALDELRPLFAQAGGISPVLHGSGTFYRGGTHILSVLTLGGPKDGQVLEGMENYGTIKRFMHQYNFPPFSAGETGRISINRRMTGHGALAEKALLPMIPKAEEFPYTIRLVSEALSSNGSTSMGSVCASTIALLDGGVPLKKPVAGISCGLMSDEKGNYKILTDIAGPEDHFGDMDFKVAGTRDGITAIQMDVKISGVSLSILAEAFEKAKTARLKILDLITNTIEEPRKEISSNVPKILAMKITPDKIGEIIGTSGKVVKAITERTGAHIEIEDTGMIYISGKNGAAEKARVMIEEILRRI